MSHTVDFCEKARQTTARGWFVMQPHCRLSSAGLGAPLSIPQHLSPPTYLCWYVLLSVHRIPSGVSIRLCNYLAYCTALLLLLAFSGPYSFLASAWTKFHRCTGYGSHWGVTLSCLPKEKIHSYFHDKYDCEIKCERWSVKTTSNDEHSTF